METCGLIQQWLISSQTEVKPSLVAQILLDITRDPNSILSVTDALSTQGYDLRKCVDLLAQITVHCRSTINEDADKLVDFACQRLNQPLVVTRCLDMMKCLVDDNNIKKRNALKIYECMMNNLPQHKLHQDARHKTLIIIDKLLQSHVDELQRQTRFDFVRGFITLIDGEKDPRNLLIAFELVRVVIAKFDISSHIEDLFDFVFCYFPITFKPPPNDPYQITTEDLKNSLRQCLASTPYFANYATPLLIDKLLTSTGSAKKDTMETIGLCAPAYGAHALLPYAQSIFDVLAKEVYNASSGTMENTALETIHHVIATLASGICVADIRVPVEKAIRSLLDPCITQLKHPESKNAKSAGYILRSAASAADPACACVVHTIIPMLTGLISQDDSTLRRKAIVDIFIEILKGNNTLYGSLEEVTKDTSSMDDDSVSPLAAYKQEILMAFMSALSSQDEHLRLSGIKGIRLMVVIRRFLLPDEFEHAIQQLVHIFFTFKEDQTSRMALATLVTICKVDPSSIEDHVLPVLLSRLSSGQSDDMMIDDFSFALEAVDALSFQPQIVRAVIPPLMDKLGHDLSCKEKTEFHYAHCLTKSILSAIRATSKDSQIIRLAQEIIFPRLLLQSVKAALCLPDAWRLDKELINLWALILAIIQRGSSASYQQGVIVDAFKVFMFGDLSVVPISSIQEKSQPLLLIPATTPDSDISVIFSAIAGNCKKEVEAPVSSCPELIADLALSTTNQNFIFSQQLAIARLIGSVANKCKNAQMPDSIKSLVTNHLIPMIKNTTTPETVRKASIFLMSWLAKALLIKSHSLGFELLDSLLQQLQSPDDLGAEAAESFIVILHDDDLVLTKAAFANISILYKQRVFYYCKSVLIQGSQSSSEAIKINHLVAFSHIITNIPTQIITNEIQKLVPSIIASLRVIANPPPLLSLIRVIQTVIPDATKAILLTSGDNVMQQLILALLGLTKGYRMDVRIAALTCLRSLALHPNSKKDLRFLAPMVTKHLVVALDDKKRQVRKEAVSCREKWFNLMDLPRV